ncbi:MAG: peptidoglycan DD-metalloendopeptidase family protein [Burkholderiaceae bacterium]
MTPHDKRFREIAIVTGLVTALAAVTAFGVAPLASSELPPARTVVDAVPLSLQVPDSLDRFNQTETIRRGDTLAQLMARLGANDAQFLRFVASDPVGRKAMQMRAGRTVQAEIDSYGRVQRFTYRLGGLEDDRDAETARPAKRVEIRRTDDELAASEQDIPLERSQEIRSVEIQSSLFAATDAAGIPEAVAIKVADVFGGDIDFQRDLRKGDRLRVVYETVREAGSFDAPATGRVLAIEFVNAGKRHDAMWYEHGGRGEYYAFDGHSLKKAFLRNPLEFSRVTSGFTESRLHPIFRDWRAHRGVDFAAPAGTRVRATADGTVEFAGQQRGYGNMVVIRHRNHYSSVYAHLQHFADGIRPGAKVSQGDVVGAVGQTGWATGPHLHYEMKVGAEHIDPMSVTVAESRVLDGPDRQKFADGVAAVRGRFAQADAVRVARFQ